MRTARLRAAGIALVALAGCAPSAPGRIDPADCRRLSLIDAAGRPVIGAEDLALAGDTLFVSAYDRLAAERAAGKAGPVPPAGGLYALPLAALDARSPVRVADILAPVLGRAVRPHGIDAVGADRSVTLGVSVREYVRGADGWDLRAGAVVLRQRPEGWTAGAEIPADARLNDVALAGPALFGSLDGGRSAFGPARGSVVELAPARRTVAGELRFANGLVRDRAGTLWVAETRADRITALPARRSLALPGAPDNLTLAPDGRIVAALLPDLLRYALHRFDLPLGAHAASRIVAVDPATGAAETLFDDPSGETFSGATVGLVAGRHLVLGAVREPGLLVCPL